MNEDVRLSRLTVSRRRALGLGGTLSLGGLLAACGGETSNGSYSLGDNEGTTTDDGTYLRGAQVADAKGIVQFRTIYPGWYRGRTVHTTSRSTGTRRPS